MNYIELFFWNTACFGTLFFILRTAATFIGFSSDDFDTSDHAFKVVSIHALTGFFMMFGWVGLAAYHQFHFNENICLGLALLAGTIMMLITHLIFKGAHLLMSPGNQFNTIELKGKNGIVYQEIPSEGAGKIQINQNGILYEVMALSHRGDKIPSFRPVIIIDIIDQETVTVKEVQT